MLEGQDVIFTTEEIRDEVSAFTVAYDVFSGTFTIILTAIGTYPHVQNKIYDE